MPPDNHDSELLAMCADFWVQKENFEKLNEEMDAENGNAADEALDKWNELQDKIQETRPVTVAGLAAKAQICQFAFLENRSADKREWSSEDELAFALMQDVAGFGVAATSAEQAALTAN